MDYLTHYVYFANWRDISEIIILSAIFLRCSTWLAREKTGVLIKKFYFYCIFIVMAYVLNLPTLLYISLMGMPFFISSLAFLHHESLARCFINYKPSSKIISNPHWLDQLSQYCFLNFYKKKSFFILVKQQDDISSLIIQETIIEGTITLQLLSFLRSSSQCSDTGLMLLDSQGHLQGINICWNNISPFTTLLQFYENSNQEALWCTKITDSWYISYIPQYKNIQLIISGVILPIESAEQLRKKIQCYYPAIAQVEQEGKKNEIHSQSSL